MPKSSRGGCWFGLPKSILSRNRDWYPQDLGTKFHSFRIIRVKP